MLQDFIEKCDGISARMFPLVERLNTPWTKRKKKKSIFASL